MGIKRITLRIAASLLLAQGLAACSGGHGPVPVDRASETSQYIIGPGDTLNIFVYHSPDLSVSSLPVRPDGQISVPLVPDIQASGRTSTQLADALQDRLRNFIKDPHVTVMINSFIGPFDRQVRVIGEAAEPVAIPYRQHMTVLDVMIQTRGLTRFAAGNRTQIIRRGPDGKEIAIRVRLNDLLKDGDIDQNMEVQPGDTLIIPQTWF